MDEPIILDSEDFEILGEEYSYDIRDHFSDIPDIAKPLMRTAKATLMKIEQMLYSAPAFINAVKASMPEITLQAVLSDEQKSQIASGALKLMTKKDGSFMANLVNPETKKSCLPFRLRASI